MMKAITISTFKTYALRIIDQVAKSQESIIITKRGKPIAELVPFRSSKDKSVPGKLAKTLVFEKDIVSPFGEEMWEVSK